MLNIIICENEKYYKLKTYDIIDKYMKKTNIMYNIMTFDTYTPKLKKFVEQPVDGHNVYILDIDLNGSDSGIDIANDIRRKDYDSIIIFETGYSQLISEAQRLRLSILDYVLKKVNYEKNILELIELSLNIFKLKGSVKFQLDKIDYNIKYEDILFIESDSNERKCNIVTKKKTYSVKKPLYFFEEQLSKHFFKINRGCIINTTNATKYDYPNNVITFDNGKTLTGMIANKNMKGLKEYVRSN